ncbi:MAG: hypothetical protein AAF380_01010 [Bacteroidota bacterium]
MPYTQAKSSLSKANKAAKSPKKALSKKKKTSAIKVEQDPVSLTRPAKKKKKTLRIKVSENQIAHKRRVAEYINAQRNSSASEIYNILAHSYFYKVGNEVLGDLIGSLDKSSFLLDRQSFANLNISKGSKLYPTHSLANTAMQEIGLDFSWSRLAFVQMLLAANNDMARSETYAKYIKAFKKHTKEAIMLDSIFKQPDTESAFYMTTMFQAKDFLSLGLIKKTMSLISFVHDVFFWWLIAIGWVEEKDLLQSNPSVKIHKFFKLTFELLQLVTEAIFNLIPIKTVLNTGRFVISWFGLLPQRARGSEDYIMFEIRQKPRERISFIVFDFFVKRFKALKKRALHKQGTWYSAFIDGGETMQERLENSLFYDPVHQLNLSNPWIYWFSWATLIIDWPYHCIIEFSRSILKLWLLKDQIIHTLKTWQNISNSLDKFLRPQAKLFRLIERVCNIIAQNPDLAKEIDGPALQAMQKLVRTKKLRKLFKNIENMSDRELSTFDVINPRYNVIEDRLVNFQRYYHLPDKYHQIIIKAMLGLASLHVFQTLGQHVYLSEKGLVENKICLATMHKGKKPGVAIKAMYTPLVKGEKVKNDFALGALNTTPDQVACIEGKTGSGKTSMLVSVMHSLVFMQTFRTAFGEEAQAFETDHIIYAGKETEDFAAMTSSYMGAAKKRLQIRQKVQASSQAGKNIAIFFDEPLGGKNRGDEVSATNLADLESLIKHQNCMVCLAIHDPMLIELAKQEKMKGFTNYTTGYDSDTGSYTYKIAKGRLSGTDGLDILQKLGWEDEVVTRIEQILAKKQMGYEWAHLLPSNQHASRINLTIDILILLFFLIGGTMAVYTTVRRRKSFE